jgi:hypothetical protein
MNKKNCKHGVWNYGCGKCEMAMLRQIEIGNRINDWMIGIASAILISGIGFILAHSFYQMFVLGK